MKCTSDKKQGSVINLPLAKDLQIQLQLQMLPYLVQDYYVEVIKGQYFLCTSFYPSHPRDESLELLILKKEQLG